MKKNVRKILGFTLVELVISLGVLALIILFSFGIYENFFDAMRNLRASNLVYEETRFLMNRLVRETRNNTVDYEEYFNQSKLKNQFPENYTYLRNEIYGQNYCEYSRQFYVPGDDDEIGTLDDQSTGQRNVIDPADGITEVPPAVGVLDGLSNDVATPLQDDLFLINVSGNERTYIKLIEGTDSLGNPIGQVGLLKLEGKDFGVDHVNAFDPNLDGSGLPCETDLGEGDGRVDTWICAEGFPCEFEEVVIANPALCNARIQKIVNDPSVPADSSFVAISPSKIDVTDLKFIISPMDDPRKAYRSNELQIQPHITIKMTAQAAAGLSNRLRTNRQPNLTLNSTVSTRIYSEIVSECNLKQCNPGVSEDKTCPLTAGVCGVKPNGPTAVQTCTADFLYSGCDTATYTAFANTNYGQPGVDFSGSSTTYYEEGLEYQSCEDDLASCIAGCLGDITCEQSCETTANECRIDRCNDGYDNDCSGAADEQDSACNTLLCSDGTYDADVEGVNGCTDVGGACQVINPLQNQESVCNDGLDNDCDGFSDQFDADCVQQYCTNGTNDPGGATTAYTQDPVTLFLGLGYTPKDYLFDATPADSAGDIFDECSGLNPSPDVAGICGTCFDTATGNSVCECGTPGCTDTRIVPGHDLLASESGDECYDGLDNDCDGGADELDPDNDCRPALCEDGGRSCDLAPTDYTPTDYLADYTDATCNAGGTANDEVCNDIGGLCQGYTDGFGFDHDFLDAGELGNATVCSDGLDNDCDGGIDWADGQGGCCAFNSYCLQNNSTTFFDDLESEDYVDEDSAQAGVVHNTVAGEITLSDPTDSNLSIRSKLIPLDVTGCSSYDLSLNGTSLTLPAGTEIEFMVSDDGGNTLCGNDDCIGDRIDSTELASAVTGLTGSSIVWQAYLKGDGAAQVPVLNDVTLSYSNCNS